MATLNNIGIPEVGTGILQPKQKNRWRVTFTNIGGTSDSSKLSMQAITVTRPSLSFEEVQLDRYNSRSFIAGKHTFEPMTLTVEDDISGGATKVIQEQLQKQQWLIGAEGQFLVAGSEGHAYKFSAKIDMLDGNEKVLETWNILGGWFQTVDYTDLDYAASDAVQITMTIRYDHAYQEVNGIDSGSGAAI